MSRRLLIAAATVSIGLIGALLGTLDDPRINVPYLAWKHGFRDFDPAVLRLLGRDPKFIEALEGKTETELRAWFPDLRTPDRANPNQQHYQALTARRDLRWIGESLFVVEFERGRVARICLWKG